jgi:AcrR family transcriptional regulator
MSRCTDTKSCILDAAERLIAQTGIDVSVRAITEAAGVNLAAVHYYFHSKDALIEAIIARRIVTLNGERLRMLEDVEIRFSQGPLPVEEVVAAFVVPVLRLGDEAAHILPLIGRISFLSPERFSRLIPEQVPRVAERFVDAFRRALPELSESDVQWRLEFMAGGLLHAMNGIFPPQRFGIDSETVIARLTVFFSVDLRLADRLLAGRCF